MNKLLLIIGFLVICGIAIGSYLIFFSADNSKGKWRPIELPPEPPVYESMANFIVTPPVGSSSEPVVLNKVFATSQANYPSTKFSFKGASSSVVSGEVFVLDRYAHWGDDNTIAAPLAVQYTGSTTKWFHLVLFEKDGDKFNQTATFPLGEDLEISTTTRDGDRVTVAYEAHDVFQKKTEPPRLATEAIVDIKTKTLVQAGANTRLVKPKKLAKIPLARYVWESTKPIEGEIISSPDKEIFQVEIDQSRFLLFTDCNTGSARYELGEEKSLTLKAMSISTKFCESDFEKTFFAMFEGINRFESEDGRLTLFAEDKTLYLYDPELTETTAEGSATSTDSE